MAPWTMIVLLLSGFTFFAWIYGEWMARRPPPPEPDLDAGTFVQIDELNIHCVRPQKSHGPTVLLVHGIGASIYCYRHILRDLADDHDVIAVDLLGFGRSDKPLSAAYDLDGQVHLLSRVLRQLGIGPCVIVGSSMGGSVALWLARQHPEQVRRLVLLAPATNPGLAPIAFDRMTWLAPLIRWILRRWTMVYVMRRVFARKSNIHRTSVDRALEPFTANPDGIKTFLLSTAAIRDPRLPAQLAGLEAPTVILWGERDQMVPRKYIDELCTILPNAELQVLSACGHHPQEDDPESVIRAIRGVTGVKKI